METGSATDVMLCSLADDQRQLEKRATNTGMHFELLQITYSLKKPYANFFFTNYNFKIES